MFRVYGKDERVKLFKPRYVLRFLAEGRKYSYCIDANTFYEVEATQQIPYTVSAIIPGEDYTVIDLDEIGLYPTRPVSVYQIILGIGGSNDVLVYPMIPETDFFLKLEKSEFTPNPSLPQRAFIGYLTKEDSPISDPKIEIITVKDYDDIALMIFNPTSVYKKVILDFTVNRCKIEEITDEKRIEEIKKENNFRDILDYRLQEW